MVDSAVGEMLRHAPVREQAPIRRAEPLHRAEAPSRSPGPNPDDLARMEQLRSELLSQTHGGAKEHSVPPLPSVETRKDHANFNLAQWVTDVFNYLTNNMFRKKA